jgi:hypothetical protein
MNNLNAYCNNNLSENVAAQQLNLMIRISQLPNIFPKIQIIWLNFIATTSPRFLANAN